MLHGIVMLGHEQNGSFALAEVKQEQFGVALGAYLKVIAEVFNKVAIPRLIDLNGEAFQGITDYPELVHGDIETHDLAALGEFIQRVVGAGAIIPDENLEDHLRLVAGFPERDEETAYMDSKPQGNKKSGGNSQSPSLGGGDDDPPEELEDGEV